MESFKKWAKLHGVFDNSTILGIPQDNPETTPKEVCRYDVCVVINKDFNVRKPAHVGEFPGGKYAVSCLTIQKRQSVNFRAIFFEIERNNLSIREQPIIERYTSND